MINFSLFKSLTFIFLMLLAPLSFADEVGLFTPVEKDLSMVFINSITGEFDSPIPETVFGALFGVLNGIVINVGLLFIVYSIFMTTISIANSGEFLEKEGGLTRAARMVIGLMLLLTHPSGYSNIQILFYNVIKAGVGLADSVWSQGLRHLDYNSFFVSLSEEAVPEDQYLIDNIDTYKSKMNDIWRGMLCSYHYNMNAQSNWILKEKGVDLRTEIFSFINPLDAKNEVTKISEYEGKVVDIFEDENDLVSFQKWLGPVYLDVSQSTTAVYFGTSNSSLKESRLIDSYNNSPAAFSRSYAPCGVVTIPTRMKGVFEQYMTELHIALPTLIEHSYDNDPARCGTYRDQEVYDLNPAFLSAVSKISSYRGIEILAPIEGGIEDNYAKYGWAAAGFYYNQVFADPKGSSSGDSVDQNQMRFSDSNDSAMSASISYGSSCTSLFESFIREAQLSLAIAEAEAQDRTPLEQLAKDADLSKKVGSQASWNSFVSVFLPVAMLSNLVYDGVSGDFAKGEDPFRKAKKTGKKMMNIAAGLMITSMILALTNALVTAICSAKEPYRWWYRIIYDFVSGFIFFMMVGLYTQGVMLAIVLPLVPVIIFATGVLGWLFAVFEAFVAAPFVALGLLWPDESNDIWGKSEPGMMILLNIFLRPSLMVIGLLMGLFLCWVSFALLGITLQVALGEGFVKPENLIGWLPLGFIYAGLLIAIAQKSFSLVFELPDKVLTWIGEQTLSWADADDIISQVSAGAKVGFDDLSSSIQSVSKSQKFTGNYERGQKEKKGLSGNASDNSGGEGDDGGEGKK